MSGRLLRLVCTAAVAAGALLAPSPAVAVPDPAPEAGAAVGAPGQRSVTSLLTDLQRLYRDAERATEKYNATAEKLKKQRAEVTRLDTGLAKARLSLHDSRGAAGRLARQQYQSSGEISSYVRLLLARDPQHALDEGHLIGQLSLERAKTVRRVAGSEKKTDALARAARKALDGQLALAERQKKERDDVRKRLGGVERLLASLTVDQLAELDKFEKSGAAEAQKKFMASGALSSERPPSREGEQALRYAVGQIGKPYVWGAEGPKSYDCSGLTSQAWQRAGHPVPRTSQEQWAELPRIPLSELRPGDLVVYFPEATHVALYAGDGMVVQAPRPGTKIEVSPIAANPLLGAVRPDPGEKPLRHYTPPRLPQPGAP
ncbi:C40 family peptidase [Streptomyces sp. NBC_01236]|uniref:C40 family peptidase n=1 Tax=Streptomyces sp. NBC_01236 TaxID=2903789 RepID=UPI002E139EF1|nr:C40 family peptidase [Streptomyces sp. NBC_01236]